MEEEGAVVVHVGRLLVALVEAGALAVVSHLSVEAVKIGRFHDAVHA